MLGAWSLKTSLPTATRSWRHDASRLVLSLGPANRWCSHLGRPHRSNGTMLVAQLDAERPWFSQHCYDADCRAGGFHGGDQFPIPPQLLSQGGQLPISARGTSSPQFPIPQQLLSQGTAGPPGAAAAALTATGAAALTAAALTATATAAALTAEAALTATALTATAAEAAATTTALTATATALTLPGAAAAAPAAGVSGTGGGGGVGGGGSRGGEGGGDKGGGGEGGGVQGGAAAAVVQAAAVCDLEDWWGPEAERAVAEATEAHLRRKREAQGAAALGP